MMEMSMDPFGAEKLETCIGENTSIGESCDVFLDFANIHTILQDKQFFL